MDARRLGTVLRSVRVGKRWRQEDVAVRARVSRSAISRLERGAVSGLTVGTIERVSTALGVRVDLVARWQGGELNRLLNARHSALHEAVARTFAALPAWTAVPEASFSVYGERGLIDILAWHAATRTVLVVELKTEIVDIQDLMGSVDRKRRLAPGVARDRGWQPGRVAAWVIVGDSRTNRRRVGEHRTTLRAAFPSDGRSIVGWLDHPTQPIAALSFWPNGHQAVSKVGLATVKRVRRPSSRSGRA